MEKVCKHLKNGGSVVYILTHPSIEDIARAGRFFSQWEEIRNRRIGGPAAIHQRLFVNAATFVFDLEKAWTVTEHTKAKWVKPGATMSRRLKKQERKGLLAYHKLMIDLLSHNGVLMVAAQADQENFLSPPIKPGVMDYILSRTKRAQISGVLYVPVGIEIEGIDYANARNLTRERYRYIFHVGESYTDEQIRLMCTEQDTQPDYLFYTFLKELVHPDYLLKQPNLP